jgi:hypothetical protein
MRARSACDGAVPDEGHVLLNCWTIVTVSLFGPLDEFASARTSRKKDHVDAV